MAGFNHFPDIIKKLHEAEHRIVEETAQDIADGYNKHAPRDTGYAASSAYIKTSDKSTYGSGGAEPPKGVTPLPEVDKPENDTTAYAAVAAPYAIYPELGTIHQAPQPAFYPAVQDAERTFEDRLRNIEEYLK
jgi:HK97 gp10 family phage protein